MRCEIPCLAGLGYPFTAGGVRALEKLIDAIPADARSYPYWKADDVAREIVARALEHDDEPTVIIVTHSWAVKTMLEAAAWMRDQGISIRYFAAIDPTALRWTDPPMVVPDNIEQIDEFWSERGWIFNFPLMARRRDPKGGAGGMVVNPHNVQHEIIPVPAGHSASARHDITRDRIVSQIRRILA